MAGRIESYLHSDMTTPNKGGALVEVTCQTDFAAKTDAFIQFAKTVAKMAYGFNADEWDQLAALYTPLVEQKAAVEKEIGEEVRVRRVVLLYLTPQWELEREKPGSGWWQCPTSGMWHFQPKTKVDVNDHGKTEISENGQAVGCQG